MVYGLDIGTGACRLVGEDSLEFVVEVDAEPESFFDDALVDDALETVLSSLLEDVPTETLYYTTPGTIVDADTSVTAHREAVESILSRLGFEATPVNTGVAVVYGELEADNRTGLGVCVEEGATSVALVYYGVPVLTFSLPFGGDWLLTHTVARTDHPREEVARALEDFVLDPTVADDPLENTLAEAYDALAAEVIDAIRTQAADGDLDRGLAVPVVVGGECAVDGLEFLLGGRFDDAGLPLSIQEVTLADDPAWSAARGALAAARDGVDGLEDVVWDAGHADDADSGATLAFEESAVGGVPADETVVEELFERLEDLEYVERWEGLEADVDALEARFADLADELEELDDGSHEEGLEDLTEHLEDHRDRIAALEDDLASLSESVSDDDLEAIETRLETLESRLTGFSGRFEELREHTDARIDELGVDIEEDVDALSAELETEVEGVRDRLEDMVDRLSSVEETVETDADALEVGRALEARIDDLADDLESVRATLETVEPATESIPEEGRLDDLETDLREVHETVEAVEDDVLALEDDLEAIEDALEDDRDLQEEIEAVADGLEDLSDRVSSVEDAAGSNADTLEAYADLEDRVGELSADVSAVRTGLEAVESTVADAASERTVSDLETDLESTADRIDGLADGLDAVETAVESNARALEEYTNEGDLEDTIDELATDLESLQGRLETVESSVETAPDGERIEVVEADLETASDRLEGFGDTLEKVESITEDHGRQLTETNEAVDGLDNRLDSALDRIEAIADLSDDVTAERDRSRELEEEVGNLGTRLEALESSLEDVTADLEATGQEAASRDDLADLRADLEAAQSESGGVTTPVLAGGGGAGIVAGGTLALAGDVGIGAAVLVVGVALLSVGITTARR